MTSTPRSATALTGAGRLPVVLTGVAAVAGLAAAVDGGTLARLTLAIAFPIAVGAWIHDIRQGRPSVLVLAVLGLLAAAGAVHVVLTSPAAAWAVDSHMIPGAVLPTGIARIAVAWMVPLLWVAVFLAVAVAEHRRIGAAAASLLLGVGAMPLAVTNAFPADSYLLLWDSTALGHPSYAAGPCAIFLMTVLAQEPPVAPFRRGFQSRRAATRIDR